MSAIIFSSTKQFKLESGDILPGIDIAYHTYGKLNREKNNVIWVCHALTANSDVFSWWEGLFGEGSLYNPEEHFIICANNLGSCYGTTGPLSVNPDTREAWYGYFPQVTIRDMANALELLRQHLGINQVHTLIGGSQGGQIAQEWALAQPQAFDHLVLLATNFQHSPWGIAFNESQRLAIKADRSYFSNTANGGEKGLQAARSIALLSYRSYQTYAETQREQGHEKINNFQAASYQRYQGEKLVSRFNAYSYVRLSEAMDSHNVARNRHCSSEVALKQIRSNTLVIGITSDLLFPPAEQQLLAKYINKAQYAEIDSFFGHDGFLIETKKIGTLIASFYRNTAFRSKIHKNIEPIVLKYKTANTL